ncbi:hypothetical protein H0264_18565 [Nocardia huaxiensis]|uniref:Uncharacterized protein n=1 Tax=Nocardia huaxiensis TaxID=2755382 RepID=A0A7D6Z7Y6_9NOCA|nr:hypothetical protein [Nocardia huaxiensis]QLY33964.1 hypothetical protein H0264_18565 [Nocardia huaxiensis]
MPSTTSRAIALGIPIGVIAGIATVATIIAVDTWNLDTRICDAVTRWRMTPDDRAALDATQALLDYQARQRERQREQVAAHKRSKFQPELCTGVPGRLSELPLSALITEILYARGRLATIWGTWGADPDTGRRDYTAITQWTGHLDALRAEFDHRRHDPADGKTLSRLDRMRWQAAHSAVHAYDEIPSPAPIPAVDTTPVAQS